MVVKKKTAVPKGAGKLKLKKETIRNLDLRKTSGQVKGGRKLVGKITCAPAECITVTG